MFSLTSDRTRFKATRRSSLLRTLRSLWSLSRSRSALARLDKAQLEDIGVTAEEARKEAARSVWDVPQHWRL